MGKKDNQKQRQSQEMKFQKQSTLILGKLQYSDYNPIWLKLIFVSILAIVGQNWQYFTQIPTNFYSWTACVWALGLYRSLNEDRIYWFNNFYFSFYSRLAWGLIFAYVTTGTLIPNSRLLIVNIAQTLITTAIFTFMPLNIMKYLWSIKIFRFLIFMFDQIIGGGLVIYAIFKQVVVQRQMLLFGLFLCIIKGIFRPAMQIITGYWNGNCSNKNRNKWLTICYLNTTRHWFLLILNYFIWQGRDLSQSNQLFGTLGQALKFFNLCFGATVGYLMYTQTYTL